MDIPHKSDLSDKCVNSHDNSSDENKKDKDSREHAAESEDCGISVQGEHENVNVSKDFSECSDTNSKTVECNDDGSITNEERVMVMNEISNDGKLRIRTYTGYIVTISVDPDRDRPKTLDSEDALKRWYAATEINLKRLKHQIQNGEYTPDDAIVEVDPNPIERPPHVNYGAKLESKVRRQEHVLDRRKKKIKCLEDELKLANVMLQVRECFTGIHNMKIGLELLEEVFKLDITPLMLMKNPFIVNTVDCLRCYGGMSEESGNDEIVICIKDKAQKLYEKLETMFSVPDNKTFEDYFKERCNLMWRMFGNDVARVYELVHDPLETF